MADVAIVPARRDAFCGRAVLAGDGCVTCFSRHSRWIRIRPTWISGTKIEQFARSFGSNVGRFRNLFGRLLRLPGGNKATCSRKLPSGKGGTSATLMEVDVASFDTRAVWQISGEAAVLLRAGFPRSSCRIAILDGEHQAAFRDLLLGLDLASRISRFSGAVKDDGILRHVRQAAREAAWIAGLFVAEELCGVVELYEAGDVRDLEAAFVVARSGAVWASARRCCSPRSSGRSRPVGCGCT